VTVVAALPEFSIRHLYHVLMELADALIWVWSNILSRGNVVLGRAAVGIEARQR
jgi:hypothetical protein